MGDTPQEAMRSLGEPYASEMAAGLDAEGLIGEEGHGALVAALLEDAGAYGEAIAARRAPAARVVVSRFYPGPRAATPHLGRDKVLWPLPTRSARVERRCRRCEMRALAAALLAALLAMPAGAVDDPTISDDAGDSWYLALGDSLAAGYQPVGDPQNDHKTRAGYPDQLWLMARGQYPNLRLRNLGCPGTNTETFRIDYPRCSYAHGSQLDEALWFIGEHRDELAFITIDLGFNDFECDSFDCLLPGIDAIEQRLPAILVELQAAAPGVPIVGMNIYDPFLTYWFEGGLDVTLAELSVGAITLINETLATIYDDADIPVADVASAFDIDAWDVLVPLAGHGDVPRNVALLCEWTWQCHPPPLGPDQHPNVLGSRVMAEAFASELGLEPVGVVLGSTSTRAMTGVGQG